MFGGPPEGYVPSEAEVDMERRLAPTPEQVVEALRLLRTLDQRERYVYVPIALPGKQRGSWKVGQPVEAVPGVFVTREGASAAADEFLGDREGVVAYAVVWRDGGAGVFEDFRAAELEETRARLAAERG